MNTKRFATFAAFFAATLLIGMPAYAQRDAASKIRGNFYRFDQARPRTYTRGFTAPGRSFSYEPGTSSRQRSYSYVADRFHVGDQVAVSADEAKLMSGSDTRGMLHKGATFQVRKINGPWLLAQVELNGKKVSGWVWYENVAQKSAADTAARSQSARRSFSYEPTSNAMRRSTARRRPLWQYQKTDPRRYRP